MASRLIHWNQPVLLLIFSGVILFSCQPKSKVQVTAFKTEAGWGYQLQKDDHVFIKQPFIPAVNGQKGFASEDDAVRTGMLVLNKLKHHKRPTISVHELDSLKITMPD